MIVDLNLDTVKRDILACLGDSGLVVFHGYEGQFIGLATIRWNSEQFPDYQQFLATAKQVGAQMVVFSHREFSVSDIEDELALLEDGEFAPEEQRDFDRRLKSFRRYEGQTCSLELSFEHHSLLYVYRIRADWYAKFLEACDDVESRLPDDDEFEDEGSLGGYFSNN